MDSKGRCEQVVSRFVRILPFVSFPANNFFARDANNMCQASPRSVSAESYLRHFDAYLRLKKAVICRNY